MENKQRKLEFFKPEVWPRVWGEEVLVAHIPGVATGKILKMKAGTRGGLQKHQVKDEAGYLVSGEMLLEYDENGDGKITKKTLHPGEAILIPPGMVHRETALTDCVIFEISNPVFNDRVRMEESYGEKIEGGLPTTTLEEIKMG